jgi:hypothetical protein
MPRNPLSEVSSMASSNFFFLSHKEIEFFSNGQHGWICLQINRMMYTMAIKEKAESAKALGVKSKGMACGCMLKMAAASAMG